MTLLAHAGGLDEMLLFLVPLVVCLVVLRLTRGRPGEGQEDHGPSRREEKV